jgi:sterol desaturase/sphingolipid hydroxylase (fatty acid hydroxylase superfamily)
VVDVSYDWLAALVTVASVLLDAFLVLMIYDFFYYVTHRFLFHGKGHFRGVYAVHHHA